MLNRHCILGRAGAAPEAKTFPNGDTVVTLSLATSRSWTDKNNGERKEQTDWHRVKFYGRLATVVLSYVHKGKLIYVEGESRTRQWTDNSNITHYATEVHVNKLDLLENTAPQNPSQAPVDLSQGGYQVPPQLELDDDLPF